LFFNKKRAEYLWLTGITMLIWVMGNSLYSLMLWMWMFVVMGLFLLWRDRDENRIDCNMNKTARNKISHHAMGYNQDSIRGY